MDITEQFFQLAGVQRNLQSKEQDYFNNFTNQIYNQTITIVQFMFNQQDKYKNKTHFEGPPFTDKERDDFDAKVQSEISICSDKIKDVQEMIKQSKTKTEYAHKEIILGCLICQMNNAILKMKEFKLYRQRQKERLAQLTQLSKRNSSQESQIREQKKSRKIEDNNDPLYQENQQILKKYDNEVKEILSIQNQILDISSSLQRMSEMIAHQEVLTEDLLISANESLLNIEQANKHLINATKMNEQFGKRWGLLFFIMAIILLFYDFINA